MAKISQRELDLEGVERGKRKYYRQIRLAMDKGHESTTNWGARMTQSAILPYSGLLSETMEKDTGIGARLLASLGLEPTVIAMMAFQSLLDGSSKGKTFTRACIEAARSVQQEAIVKALKDTDKDRFLRFKDFVAGRSDSRKLRNIKEMMQKTVPELVDQFAWSDEECLKAGYVLAMTAIEATGLLERITFKRSARSSVSTLVLTKDAWDYIHKAMSHAEMLHPIKLPMVVPPRKWVNPDDGGYEQGVGDCLVRGSTKVAKESHTKEAMPLVYESINLIQHTPFRVNAGVLAAALQVFERRIPIGDLDVHDELPMPVAPPSLKTDFKLRTDEQIRTTRLYFLDASRVAEYNRRINSRRIGVLQTLNLARRFAEEKDLRFFHAAALDFRGRFYCQATGLSHQGSDLQRGLVEFGLGHVIPKQGEAIQAWLRHGATVLGKKGTLEERANAAAALIRSGEADAIARDPAGTASLWGKADEPFSYLAWCLDVKNVREGKPSHLMVAVDGSCNGIQVLSLLLRDEVGAASVNIIPSNKPSDIYQAVADRTMVRIEEAVRRGETYAAEWQALGVSRGMVKRPVMCLPYSITPRSAMMYLKEAYTEMHRDGPWPDPARPCGFLIRKVWPSIGEIVVKGSEFLAWARAAGRIITSHGIHPMWVTPDGFTVQQSYYTYDPSRVRTTLGREAHIWQIRNKTAKINRRKHISGLVPNLVHSLDATAARETARRLHAKKVPDTAFVHDSYLVHAAFQPVLAAELREAWVSTFSGDPLGDWVRQIESQLPVGVKLPPPPAYGNLDIGVIRQSKYFFS